MSGPIAFSVCPRCGVRNAVRPGSAQEGYCIKCDPRPTVEGLHVQVHGCQAESGEVTHYRLRVVNNTTQEVLYSEEPLTQADARARALELSRRIVTFFEALGM